VPTVGDPPQLVDTSVCADEEDVLRGLGPGGWVGSSGQRARTWACSVGQPRAWRTIDSWALLSTTSSGTAEQCWQANTSIRESVWRRRPDLRVNDAQPGRAAGAETGIAPSAPGRLRRGHRGHRGLIPLPVRLGRLCHPYRLGRAVLSCGYSLLQCWQAVTSITCQFAPGTFDVRGCDARIPCEGGPVRGQPLGRHGHPRPAGLRPNSGRLRPAELGCSHLAVLHQVPHSCN
jgi:hypothetical protein